MKKILFFTLLTIISFHLQASDYWQQHVKYKINVRLDDKNHTLEGTEVLSYTNHSPQTLKSIMFNLWANAFSTKASPFAKQQLRTRNLKFHFAKKEQMGGYERIRFEEGGRELSILYKNNSREMAEVMLNRPLEPGASITIKISFKLKIPYTFSRLGHVGQSYQMTQWYPKPAVYDARGWHPIPYLDLGEFYSEFGQYDVEITLPDNYIVGATGILLTESEKTFRRRIINESLGKIRKQVVDSFKVALSDSIPPSSFKTKTIRFVADQVHDFAWFADKRFLIVKDEATLPSGRKVPTYGYFKPSEAKLWQHSADYVKQAVEFFSKKIGEYPWPHASAVLGPLSAGGGMEYPMITIIAPMTNAKTLDLVINHEVGHNWYYGILASNERDHAWMDEGMNSYIDGRYIKMKYGHYDMVPLPSIIEKTTDIPFLKLLYSSKASVNTDQPGDLPSDDYLMTNYQLSAYSNPQMYFEYLEEYLGTEQMDIAMHHYFDKWKFKHPYPEDVQQAYEEASGKDLDWLFQGLLAVGAPPNRNPRMDYALKGWSDRATNTVRAVNKGDIAAPVVLQGIKKDSVIKSIWFDGFKGSRNLSLGAGDYDLVVLDYENKGPDVFMENQSLRTHGWAKYKPINISYLGIGLNHSRKLNDFIFPALGYNAQDGFMAGVLYHNITLPQNPFKFYLIPMYGFKSKTLAGIGDINYNFYPRGKKLKRMRIGVFGRKFSINSFTNPETHIRIAPYLSFRLKKELKSMTVHDVHFIFDNSSIMYSTSDILHVNFDSWRGRLIYEMNTHNPVHSKSLKTELFTLHTDYSSTTALTLSYQGKWHYSRKNFFKYRVFQGYFFGSSRSSLKGEFYLTYNNLADVGLFDDYYFGRTYEHNIYSRQINIGEGGFKDPVLVEASKSLTALNLEMSIPRIPYSSFFLDQAIALSEYHSRLEYYMSTGVAFNLQDAFAIYIPLYNVGLEDAYEMSGLKGNKWLRRISFMVKLKWNLNELPENLLYIY